MSAQTASATDLNPDGELIGLCRECDALYQRFQATFQDELTLKPDMALQEKRKVIIRLQRNVLDQICATHATTLEGLRARDRVNVLGNLLGVYWTQRMTDALHRDMRGHVEVMEDVGVQFAPSISIPALPGDSQPALQNNQITLDASASAPQILQVSRRRPGRRQVTNSHLVALLRDPSMAGIVDQDSKPDDRLGIARIIVAKSALSIPSRAVLALLAFILMRMLSLSARL